MPAAIPKVPLLHIPQRVKAGLVVFVVAMGDRNERLVDAGGGELVGHRSIELAWHFRKHTNPDRHQHTCNNYRRENDETEGTRLDNIRPLEAEAYQSASKEQSEWIAVAE